MLTQDIVFTNKNSPSNQLYRWLSLGLVIGLHMAAAWVLWHSQIRHAAEQITPIFVSLIISAPPKVEEPPPLIPPPPEPVKLEPIKKPLPLEPPQIVSEAPVVDQAEFIAPSPDPIPVEPVPVIAAAPIPEQITLPELAVACPDRSPPVYPVWSKRMREQGEVILQVYLDTGGQVVRIEVNRTSGSPRLDEAALQAVQRWRCRPATKDGLPVTAVALQSINFVIN